MPNTTDLDIIFECYDPASAADDSGRHDALSGRDPSLVVFSQKPHQLINERAVQLNVRIRIAMGVVDYSRITIEKRGNLV